MVWEGMLTFAPYIGQAYAAGLLAGLSEKERDLEQIRTRDDKIEELEKVISAQVGRIEELQHREDMLQKENMDSLKRQMDLEKKAEALLKKVRVLDHKRRCKVLGEQEVHPVIERNVELEKHLQEALQGKDELEVKVEELQKSLFEAAAKQEDAILEALEDAELLRALKRSKEYLSSGGSVADWRAADGKGVEKVQRKRRDSEPPRLHEVIDKLEEEEETMRCIHDCQRERLPPMTPFKRMLLYRELFGELVEVRDCMGRWNLDVKGLWAP